MVDTLGPASGRPPGPRQATDAAASDRGQAGPAPDAGTGAGPQPARAVDSVRLSDEARQLPPALQGGAPIDREAVDRIKTAIAEGEYPIDRERIAQKLHESFEEMTR
jgi:flagellar biosynthesis anti-sigma factor FlgM